MEKTVCIVTAGDPENKRFDYSLACEPLRRTLEAQGVSVILAESAKEGIQRLEEESAARHEKKLPHRNMYVVYVSAHYCEEALQLAKSYSPRIRFVVYTVGLAPLHMPTFVFRGMLTSETFGAIFA